MRKRHNHRYLFRTLYYANTNCIHSTYVWIRVCWQSNLHNFVKAISNSHRFIYIYHIVRIVVCIRANISNRCTDLYNKSCTIHTHITTSQYIPICCAYIAAQCWPSQTQKLMLCGITAYFKSILNGTCSTLWIFLIKSFHKFQKFVSKCKTKKPVVNIRFSILSIL